MLEYNQAAIGKVIRAIRRERGLSQEILSGLAGIARSHLAMIETGSKHANFETLWKLANAFEMPPHLLVKEIENEIKQQKNPS